MRLVTCVIFNSNAECKRDDQPAADRADDRADHLQMMDQQSPSPGPPSTNVIIRVS